VAFFLVFCVPAIAEASFFPLRRIFRGVGNQFPDRRLDEQALVLALARVFGFYVSGDQDWFWTQEA